jgi:hypothetical protein
MQGTAWAYHDGSGGADHRVVDELHLLQGVDGLQILLRLNHTPKVINANDQCQP